MENLNIPPEIDDKEFLFRGVHENQFDPATNRPSSVAFKDSGGASVDRNFDRSDGQCISFLLTNKPFFCILKVSAENVRETGAYLIHKTLPGNSFHCIITDSEVAKKCDKKAKGINQQSIIVYRQDENIGHY